MTLLQITKRKRPASQESEAFAEKLTQSAPAQSAARPDDAAALRKKLGTDTRPIAPQIISDTPPAAPPKPEAAPADPKTESQTPPPPAEVTPESVPQSVPQSVPKSISESLPDHPAYKGERERITGRFKSELVVKLDAIGLLAIEDRNSIIERVLETWVEQEWKRLKTANGKADLEFAHGRARAALEKKRGR